MPESLFLVIRPATLFKKRVWHSCFPVNFAKFLRTTFIIEHLRWLLHKKHGNCLELQGSQPHERFLSQLFFREF